MCVCACVLPTVLYMHGVRTEEHVMNAISLLCLEPALPPCLHVRAWCPKASIW